MANTIYTKQTSSVTSDIVNPILIDQTGTTRRVLMAKIVENEKDPSACVSGTIIHQRKSVNGVWEPFESIKLSTLKSGEGVQMIFSCGQMKNLRTAIEKAYALGGKGVIPSGKYVFGSEEEIVKVEKNIKDTVQLLLDKNLGEEIWSQLVESNPDLATKLSLAKIQSDRVKTVSRFENMLLQDYNEKYWQKFFTNNDWIFGYGLSYIFTSITNREIYVGGKNINNSGGSVADFMASSGGDARYNVLIEIKRPTAPLISPEDRNNCFPISADLAKAVSQIQCYCQTWGENSTREMSRYEYENKLIHTHPKGIIVIGSTSSLTSDPQRRSFELFRSNLNGVEIITYDELLARAKFIVSPNINAINGEDNDLPF